MKIGILTTVHAFGDPRIFHKQAISLQQAGHQVHYIGQVGPEASNYPGISFFPLPNAAGLGGRIRNLVAAAKIAFKIRCPVYHLHDPELIPLGFLLKILLRAKVIYDIHELHFDEIRYKPYLSPWAGRVLGGIYYLVDRIAIRSFDRIILAEEAYLSYYAVAESKVTVVQNYLLNNEPDLQPARQAAENKRLKLVYLGSITKIRGIFELIDFVRILGSNLDVELHLIGKFASDELQKETFGRIQQNELGDRMTYHGVLPYEEAHKKIREFDVGLIFLHPIVNNLTILPTKLFEYMGYGLPVIMSDFPRWKDFNDQYRCGLTIDIFEIEKALDKVLKFLSDPKKLAKMGQRNAQIVREKFVWRIEAEKLLDVYRKLEN